MKQLLPVKMTPVQLCERAEDLSISLRDLEAREQRKAFLDSMKDRLASIEERVQSLAAEVRDQEIIQPVDCSEELDGDTVILIRLDTGEVVSSRPATAEDRQLDIGVRLRGVE